MEDERPRWTTVFPFVFGMGCFAAIALIDHVRGIDLWRNYALSGIGLGLPVTYAVWRTNVRLPHYVQWIIVAALLLHYGGGSLASKDPFHLGPLRMHGVNGAYHTFPWWDHLTHGMGIGAGTVGLAYLFELYQMRRNLGWAAWQVGVLAFAAGLAAGVAVELYEYLGKTLFQTIDQGGYRNTVEDLQFNAYGAGIGAALAATINRVRMRSRIEGHLAYAQATHTQPQSRIPPAMAGLIAFVAVPAVFTVVLGLNGFMTDTGDLDPNDYDGLLQTLLVSAVAGVVAAPLVTWWRRR